MIRLPSPYKSHCSDYIKQGVFPAFQGYLNYDVSFTGVMLRCAYDMTAITMCHAIMIPLSLHNRDRRLGARRCILAICFVFASPTLLMLQSCMQNCEMEQEWKHCHCVRPQHEFAGAVGWRNCLIQESGASYGLKLYYVYPRMLRCYTNFIVLCF